MSQPAMISGDWSSVIRRKLEDDFLLVHGPLEHRLTKAARHELRKLRERILARRALLRLQLLAFSDPDDPPTYETYGAVE